jgi:hypothetical protein
MVCIAIGGHIGAMLPLLAIVCVVLLAVVVLVRTVLRDGLDVARPRSVDWAAGTTLAVPRSIRVTR